MNQGPTHPSAGRTRRLLALATLPPLLLVLVVACSSMSKNAIEQGLRDLPSNALPEGARSVRRTLQLDLGQGPRSHDVAWLEVDARPDAASRRPLVLVHGTPGSYFTWTPLLFGEGGLAGSRPIYALEGIGHGFARGEARPYGFERCAAYLAAWMEALGLREVDLLGHSYGGEVCLGVALDHPERVGRLILMDSSGIQRRPDEFLPEEVKMREWSVARFGYLFNSAKRVNMALELHFQGEVRADFLREITLSCESAENWRCMVALVRDENGNRQGDLPRLSQPTLLLWGSEDLAYPPDRFARAFAEALPDARLEVLSGAGHYPFEERPAETAERLRSFLDTDGEGTPPPRGVGER